MINENTKNWTSVRTILEALILAALLWTGNTLTTLKVQFAILQAQLANVNTALADVADLKTRMGTLERDQASLRTTAMTNVEAIRELRQSKADK